MHWQSLSLDFSQVDQDMLWLVEQMQEDPDLVTQAHQSYIDDSIADER